MTESESARWKGIGLASLLVCAMLATTAAAQVAPTKIMRLCFVNAGSYYKIPPALLTAIAKTESHFDARSHHHNRGGSIDVGLMQINSRWFPKLHQRGIERRALMDPCTSIWVAAWILSDNIDRFGYTWKAIGAYNAGGADAAIQRRQQYISRVAMNMASSDAEMR